MEELQLVISHREKLFDVDEPTSADQIHLVMILFYVLFLRQTS